MSKIYKMNLTILLVIIIGSSLADGLTRPKEIAYTGLMLAMGNALAILVMMVANFMLMILSLIKKDGKFKEYILSIILILVIGIPLCLGGGMLSSAVSHK